MAWVGWFGLAAVCDWLRRREKRKMQRLTPLARDGKPYGVRSRSGKFVDAKFVPGAGNP
jgi:hypothetical protein